MSFTPEEMAEFEKIIRNAVDGRVVSNFVLIAEMVSPEGQDIEVYLSEMMTPWLATGMLNYAKDLILDAAYGDQEEI